MSRLINAFEFVDGTRNSKQILYQNNLFNKHLGIQWRCMSCASMMNVNVDERVVTREPAEHIGHGDVSQLRIAVMKSIKKMKDDAFNDPDIDLKAIYDRNVKCLTTSGYLLGDIVSRNDGNLLPYTNFRGTLAAIRKQVVPILPITISDIDFTSPAYTEYTKTDEGKLFLQYDNNKPTKRVLIFMSQFGIDWLRESLKNHSDGTFNSAPKLFFQFYVIFGQKNLMILPCAYCCLPNKTSACYVEMLIAIKNIVKPLGDLNNLSPYLPDTALTDFELAIMQAFLHVFPAIEIKGCYFHFKHAHQGWINRNGWKKIYRSDNDFRIWVNMFGALALMPIDKIDECLVFIKAKASGFAFENKNVQDIIQYFEKTWINGVYKPNVWNYFDYIGRKTNNDLESFNKQANAVIKHKKPSIFKFINFLKKCDASMTMAVHDYRENPTNPAQFLKNSKRVEKSRIDYANKLAFIEKEISLSDYLYSQAANIDFIEFDDPDNQLLESSEPCTSASLQEAPTSPLLVDINSDQSEFTEISNFESNIDEI